jgi:hypothetical protein
MDKVNEMKKDRTYIDLEIMFLELFEACKTEDECNRRFSVLEDILTMAHGVSVGELET